MHQPEGALDRQRFFGQLQNPDIGGRASGLWSAEERGKNKKTQKPSQRKALTICDPLMAQFACHAVGDNGDNGDRRAGEAGESAEGTGDAEAVTGRSLLTNVRSDRQRWRQAFLYKYNADNAERMVSTSRQL